MARHNWHPMPKMLRNRDFLRLTAASRGVLVTVRELLHDDQVMSGNVSDWSTWTGIDRKTIREAFAAIAEVGLLYVGREERGKEGTIYTLATLEHAPSSPQVDPNLTPTSPQVDPKLTPSCPQTDPKLGPDESANNADSGHPSLIRREEMRGEGEERENARASVVHPLGFASQVHPDAQRLCDLLAELVEQSHGKRPSVTIPWLDGMEGLLVSDKLSPPDVEGAIRFAHGDSFWRTVILEPRNLRKNWDKLLAQAQRGRDSPKQKNVQDDDIAAFLRERGSAS